MALVNDEVVGMGRLVGDGVMYWYLQEIVVLPEYQGNGIGTAIVNKLLKYVEEHTDEGNFAYNQFFNALEQTVEEMAKCFLFEFGDNKELSYGRCKTMKSFNDLYDGLNNIE